MADLRRTPVEHFDGHAPEWCVLYTKIVNRYSGNDINASLVA